MSKNEGYVGAKDVSEKSINIGTRYVISNLDYIFLTTSLHFFGKGVRQTHAFVMTAVGWIEIRENFSYFSRTYLFFSSFFALRWKAKMNWFVLRLRGVVGVGKQQQSVSLCAAARKYKPQLLPL